MTIGLQLHEAIEGSREISHYRADRLLGLSVKANAKKFKVLHTGDPDVEKGMAVGDYFDNMHLELSQGKIKLFTSLYRGHIILSCKDERNGNVIIFTPRGQAPYALPDLTKSNRGIIKKSVADPFLIKESQIPTQFVFHGAPLKNTTAIMKDGINYDLADKGDLGKGFYVTTDYKYAIANYATENARVKDDEAGLLILQIRPEANIVADGDGRESQFVLEHMGRNDVREVMDKRGVDGFMHRAGNSIVIFNPDAVNLIRSVSVKELKREMELSQEGLSL